MLSLLKHNSNLLTILPSPLSEIGAVTMEAGQSSFPASWSLAEQMVSN